MGKREEEQEGEEDGRTTDGGAVACTTYIIVAQSDLALESLWVKRRGRRLRTYIRRSVSDYGT